MFKRFRKKKKEQETPRARLARLEAEVRQLEYKQIALRNTTPFSTTAQEAKRVKAQAISDERREAVREASQLRHDIVRSEAQAAAGSGGGHGTNELHTERLLT
jgi:hypothetical protein